MAQPANESEGAEPPFASWILLGADVGVHDRVRVVARLGHLGDIDSRLVLAESSLAVRPALQVVFGYVFIAPTASSLPGTSLIRAGGTWLPMRRRLTIENRLWIERRTTRSVGSAIRIRNRFRAFYARPVNLPFTVFGSIEPILAIRTGLVENRIQLGGTRSLGPMNFEGYWLQRRLPASTTVNGFGLTTSWRFGH